MAIRSIWKGDIGFGLVNAHARIYGAVEDKEFHFNQVHRPCGHRITMPRFCQQCNRFVEMGEMAKGYSTGDGYILLEDSDLEALPLKSTKRIEIVAFLPKGVINDPRLMDTPYYVSPDKGGEKVMHLLLRSMEDLGRVALGKWATRGREHLVLLIPLDGVLLCQTLRWADEVRPTQELPKAQGMLTEKEKELAYALIRTLSQDEIDLSSFKDEYREAVEELIRRKASGEVLVPVGEQSMPVGDLAESLVATLAGMGIKV